MKTLKNVEVIKPFDLYDITVDNDHCYEIENGVIAHNSIYSAPQQSGGGGIQYASDVVIMLTKAKEKEGTNHVGAILSLNIQKSRFIPENVKGKVIVMFKKGIYKYSYLLELGLEFGVIKKEGISYVLNGVKMKRTEIIKKPELFYTTEGLEIVRQAILKNWSFGGDDDIEIDDMLDDEDESKILLMENN